MTIANGWPCNQGQWIIEDDAASDWLYLRCGLVRIARSDMQAWAANPQRSVEVTTFDRTDGVRLSGVNKLERPMVAKSSDGKLWMIYPGMLGLIDPANLPRNAIPPPVHVEQITADGTPSRRLRVCGYRPRSAISASTTPPSAWSRRKGPLPFSTGRAEPGWTESSTSARYTIRIPSG